MVFAEQGLQVSCVTAELNLNASYKLRKSDRCSGDSIYGLNTDASHELGVCICH
jgi:hypothetical protein